MINIGASARYQMISVLTSSFSFQSAFSQSLLKIMSLEFVSFTFFNSSVSSYVSSFVLPTLLPKLRSTSRRTAHEPQDVGRSPKFFVFTSEVVKPQKYLSKLD